nr:translation initiation factor IF-2-like [Taeniopygia guttata]
MAVTDGGGRAPPGQESPSELTSLRGGGRAVAAGGAGRSSPWEARAAVAGSVPPSPRGSPRRPGRRPARSSLRGGPTRGARLWAPLHPGPILRRRPGAPCASLGTRNGGGRGGVRACVSGAPQEGEGSVLLPRCGPGIRAAKQRDLSKERSPPGAGARKSAGSPPRPADRDAGYAASRSRKEQWPCGSQAASPAHPGLPSGMRLPARPPPSQAAASSPRRPRVEPHHCEAARKRGRGDCMRKSIPCHQAMGFCVTPRAARPVAPP